MPTEMLMGPVHPERHASPPEKSAHTDTETLVKLGEQNSSESRTPKVVDIEERKAYYDETRDEIERIAALHDFHSEKAELQALAHKNAEYFSIPSSLEHLPERWILEKPLAEGAMGVAYDAYDINLRREVVVKLLSSRRLSKSGLERFKREAQLTAQFESPYVVRIYDAGYSEDGAWYAMNKVKGGDLKEEMKREPLTLEKVLKVGTHVAHGIEDLQEKGIVHRDLKPANIFFNPVTNTYQLGDFGLATLMEDTVTQEITAEVEHELALREEEAGTKLTKSGDIIGSPAYMSPERFTGEQSEKSEVWALGVMLYEMLSGSNPFSGGNIAEVIQAIRQKHPPLLNSIDPKIPRGLAVLINQMLEKDPDDRPAAREVLAGLSLFEGHDETFKPVISSKEETQATER